MNRKSARRSLGSLTLAFQAFVVFFAMLAAFGLKLADGATVWSVGLTLSVVTIATPAILGKSWSYWFGWLLQLCFLVISLMTIPRSWLGYLFMVLSLIFIGLWGWAMIAGSTIDAANRVLEREENTQNGLEEIQ